MSDALSIRQQQQQLVLSGTGPTSEFIDLEDAVIVEILSRLPPKSLLRFRCVCKAWRALISDPYFIRQHLTRANNSYSYPVLVREMSTFRSIDSEALFKCGDGPFPSRELYFLVIDPLINRNKLDIIGSCNGLICLVSSYDCQEIMLWNPSTREIKVLLKHRDSDAYCLCCPFCGFGYDSTTDDYKVIVGEFRISEQGAIGELIVLVYTVRTGSWRKLQDLNHTFKLLGPGCLANGALYWVQDACKLVSFDLAEEKFHEIPSPNYPSDRCNRLVASAGKFRNSLAICSRGPGSEYMMWVMKEAGGEKSWNEVIKIPKEVLHVLLDSDRVMWKPLSISNDGVALICVLAVATPHTLRVLTLYNPKENRCRNVTEPFASTAATYVTYVETLVSPFTRFGM